MSKMGKNDVSRDYLEKIKDWQEHQYDPGYYTGGNIPPVWTDPGKPKLLGWFLIITSFILAVIMAVFFKSIFRIKDVLPISIIAILFYGVLLLQSIWGWRLIKKNSSIEFFKKVKKTVIIVSCTVIIIFVLISSLNVVFLNKESIITIDDVEAIELKQEYDKNYLILYNGKLLLNCDNAYYYDIWSVKVTNSKATFKIRYRWNILNKDNGRVINVERVE